MEYKQGRLLSEAVRDTQLPYTKNMRTKLLRAVGDGQLKSFQMMKPAEVMKVRNLGRKTLIFLAHILRENECTSREWEHLLRQTFESVEHFRWDLLLKKVPSLEKKIHEMQCELREIKITIANGKDKFIEQKRKERLSRTVRSQPQPFWPSSGRML